MNDTSSVVAHMHDARSVSASSMDLAYLLTRFSISARISLLGIESSFFSNILLPSQQVALQRSTSPTAASLARKQTLPMISLAKPESPTLRKQRSVCKPLSAAHSGCLWVVCVLYCLIR